MHYADYKTVLLANNTMNLYRGCTHGCIYCDSRSVCYQINHPFEDIEVKRDADKILDDQLRRRRRKAMINTGSMCDPYIPLESELRLTRRALEVIARHGFGLSILTKSDRILRDLDLLEEINRRQKCVVQVTLTTFDEKLCAVLEPNVSGTKARVEVLKECRRRGIPTVVWLSPILPLSTIRRKTFADCFPIVSRQAFTALSTSASASPCARATANTSMPSWTSTSPA